MASRKYMERRRKIASEKGRKGVAARRRKMLEDAENTYALARVIEIRMPDGRQVAAWKVYATGCPTAPLAVDFNGSVHRYLSPRRLSPLLARKMFDVVDAIR